MSLKISQLLALSVCLALPGCTGGDDPLKRVVAFQYDHVANVRTIQLDRSVQVAGGSVGTLLPAHGGFWAVFVICSLDVQGNMIETFGYNANNFAVDYNSSTFASMQPFSLLSGGGTFPTPADLPAVRTAVVETLHLGPLTQPFPRAFYPSLNYRVAVFIPEQLRDYQGEEFTLRYTGQPSILQGRGWRPTDLESYRPSSGGVAGGCRPGRG